MKNIKIEVTQQDIDNGKRASCFYCPIALVCTRTFKELCLIGESYLGFIRGGKKYPLPQNARQFVTDFDHGRPVKPFTFELNTQ